MESATHSIFPTRRAWFLAMSLLATSATAPHAAAPDHVAGGDFVSQWRFSKGDPAGAEQPRFDDASWETVRLPHDWAITGPFNPQENGYAGKLPWRGVGWYRKQVALDLADDARVYLDFDGVMAFPQVYVNGQLAGDWDYGYTPFRIDATPYVKRRGDNVIAVRVDTNRHGTRWYPGAGIYRRPKLVVKGPVHFAVGGVYATTPEVTDEQATVRVEVTAENHGDAARSVEVRLELFDDEDQPVAHAKTPLEIAPGVQPATVAFQVQQPQKWDVDSPKLYRLQASVVDGEQTLDECAVPVGFRIFKFTTDGGFRLNGRRVELQGVNLHHDLGPLGAAFNVRAAQRQLEIMQEMGVNALRTSHNPPAAEVLDLCDRMGIVVWDECFDKWNQTADRVDGQPPHLEHGQRHLRAMMLRDRNHPCVVLWSIGNEIPADREGANPQRVKQMADIARKYDSTRPITMASCHPDQVARDMYAGLDVIGWNYARRYAASRERHPEQPIVYSESGSALSSRGYYRLPLARSKTDFGPGLQVDSYELNSASYSDVADAEFRLMDRDRFVAGEFVWTGFDYLGEPNPHEEESKSSYFGIVDLCGIPKERYWLYRSRWRQDATTVHLSPHWNWPDRVGQNVPVFVYASGDEAELRLNGRSLGRRRRGERPPRPANLLQPASLSASSAQADRAAPQAGDGERSTLWTAAERGVQWLAGDLGTPQPIRCVAVEFDKAAADYGFALEVSDDGQRWRTAVERPLSKRPSYGVSEEEICPIEATVRYVRVRVDENRYDAPAGVRELAVYSQPIESSYYDATYDYRIRFNDVVYEPGEITAVAFRDGKEIGRATRRTAGPPAAVRLTPDRTAIAAGGDDLCFVLVEALDEAGVPCPLADDKVQFTLAGSLELAGVGNGDPAALDPFHEPWVKLFFGKAMLIVRSRGAGGGMITAAAAGLAPGRAEVRVE